MASRRRVILQVLAYTLYGLVVFLLLLYLTFPYDLLRQRLMEGFSQGNVRLTIARVQPGFPPSLTLHDVRLITDFWELPGAMVQVRRLRLQPVWLSLLSGTPQMHVDAALYGGHWRGEIGAVGANTPSVWEVRGGFANLQIERHAWSRKRGAALMRGRLGGDLALTLSGDGQIQQGTLHLRAQPATVVRMPNLLLQRDVTCDTLQSQLKMSAKQVQIVSFTCEGNDLSIQARGTVDWRRPLWRSGLNLHLQIRSAAAYKRELALLGGLVRRPPDRRGVLSFSIRGTVQRPRIGA